MNIGDSNCNKLANKHHKCLITRLFYMMHGVASHKNRALDVSYDV